MFEFNDDTEAGLDQGAVQKDIKKKVLVTALKDILDACCANPVDWNAYEEWSRQYTESLNDKTISVEPYKGYMRYDITVHCRRLEIVARKNKNGGYHIKETNWIDH